jgi:hypothetical protein
LGRLRFCFLCIEDFSLSSSSSSSAISLSLSLALVYCCVSLPIFFAFIWLLRCLFRFAFCFNLGDLVFVIFKIFFLFFLLLLLLRNG